MVAELVRAVVLVVVALALALDQGQAAERERVEARWLCLTYVVTCQDLLVILIYLTRCVLVPYLQLRQARQCCWNGRWRLCFLLFKSSLFDFW